jgi:flagellar biosynthetic protein FliO
MDWTTFFYIVVMIAVIVAAYVATKYLAGKGRSVQSRHIRILDRMMLARDKHIALIEVGDKNLLIGVTNQTINVLGDIDGETLKTQQNKIEQSAHKGSASKLRNFIIRMKDAPNNLRMARNEAKINRQTKVDSDDYLARMADAIQMRKERMTGGNEGDE